MIRRIIHIDKEKCNGCGACASACHEGAIGMVNGKAELLRDDYCDGLGDCLPTCPTGAITFVEREALEYDKEAVEANMKKKKHSSDKIFGGCPSSKMHIFNKEEKGIDNSVFTPAVSQLGQWPCQIKLVPVNAPYFENANLLIAADCTAYAYANMHSEFMKGKITLIGCPKLDNIDYSEKLTEIIKYNNIKSITVVRMEVPCCGGLEYATTQAIKQSGKFLPWHIVTIGIDGKKIDG